MLYVCVCVYFKPCRLNLDFPLPIKVALHPYYSTPDKNTY